LENNDTWALRHSWCCNATSFIHGIDDFGFSFYVVEKILANETYKIRGKRDNANVEKKRN
jgi:hypothetical protein